jgi:hypothetical protein
MFCLIFFDFFVLFISIPFKPQKLDIVLKRIEYDLSSASTIRYQRAKVLEKVLLSIDIFIFYLYKLFREDLKSAYNFKMME